MKIIMKWFLLFVFIVSLACSGKSNEEKLLIMQVDSLKYYSDEFWADYRRSPDFRSAKWDQLEYIKEYLKNSKEKTLLMLSDAINRKVDTLDEVKIEIERLKRNLMINKYGPLYKKLVLDNLDVSDKEARDLYKKLKYKYRLKHILVKEKKLADSIYTLLKNGADFDQMVKKYSGDYASVKNNGDMGFFSWDNTSLPVFFKEIVFSLKKGEFSQPIEMPYGYHIVKMEDIVPYKGLKSFKEEKKRLINVIKGIKINERIKSYMERLKKEANIVFNYSLINKIEKKIKKDSVKKINFNDSTMFTKEELNTFFVSYKYGKFTLGEFLEYMKKYHKNYLDRLFNFEQLKERLQNDVLMQEMMYKDAVKQGLDADKTFIEQFEKRKNNMLVRYIKKIEIIDKINITDSLRKDFYQKNKHTIFYIKPQVSFRAIVCSTVTDIRIAYKRLLKKEAFTEVARKLSIDKKTASRGGFWGTLNIKELRKPLDKEFYKHLKNLKKNQYSKFFKFNNRYYIVQKVNEVKEGIMPYKKALPQINRELKKIFYEKYEAEYLKKLRKKYPVQYFDENIKKVVEEKKAQLNKNKKKK